MKSLLRLSIFIILLFSCSKNEPMTIEGVLRDPTNMENCYWLIHAGGDPSTSPRLYEPLNLDDFNLPLEDYKKVAFKYEVDNNATSDCQPGVTFEFTKKVIVKLIEIEIIE